MDFARAIQELTAARRKPVCYERKKQQELKIEVWMGLMSSYLISPFRLFSPRNSELLKNVPLNLSNEVVFMQDGALPHFGHQNGNVQRQNG